VDLRRNVLGRLDVAQDRSRWRAFMLMVMKHQGSVKWGGGGIYSLLEGLAASRKGPGCLVLVNDFVRNCLTAIVWRSVGTVALLLAVVKVW
jgi:hypothetical protein